jgi:hypothetical protein
MGGVRLKMSAILPGPRKRQIQDAEVLTRGTQCDVIGLAEILLPDDFGFAVDSPALAGVPIGWVFARLLKATGAI